MESCMCESRQIWAFDLRPKYIKTLIGFRKDSQITGPNKFAVEPSFTASDSFGWKKFLRIDLDCLDEMINVFPNVAGKI